MKILYHHTTLGEGGEGVHIREMVRSFRELGHDVVINSPQTTEVDREQKINIFGLLKKNSPSFLIEAGKLFFNFINYFKLKWIINKWKPDFIYARYALYDYAPVVIAKKYKIPLILEVNNPFIYLSKKNGNLFFTGLAKKFEREIFIKADALICVSNALKNHLFKLHKLKRKHVYVIHNGVNLNLFNFKTPNKISKLKKIYGLEGKLVIGFVGNFNIHHKLFDLIKVFSKIIKKYQNTHLLLVGDGILKKRLINYVKRYNIEQCVTFAGKIPHFNVPFYISIMDITTMPNSNFASSHIRIFEYMAMGKPCVIGASPGVREVIKDGSNGYLVNNIKELENAILKLIKTKKLRKKLGENARKTVIENKYTWDTNAKKVIYLYQNLTKIY